MPRLLVVIALFVAGQAFSQTQAASWPSTPEELQQCRTYCGGDETCGRTCSDIGAIVTAPGTSRRPPSGFERYGEWVRGCLGSCEAEESCVALCRRVFTNSVRCETGQAAACAERPRDLADIEQHNKQGRKLRAKTPQAIEQCLKETAASAGKWCEESACNNDRRREVMGQMQRVRCGYSAIQVAEPAVPGAGGTPQTDYVCADMLIKQGRGWGYAMQVCTR